MGILNSIERGLERSVNRAFARTFHGSVQPLEISAALRRELDVRAVAVDRDRVLAPNIFTVTMSAADAEKLQQHGPQLHTELTQVVTKHAAQQGYQLLGPVSLTFATAQVPSGSLEVTSQTPNDQVTWHAALEVGGKTYPLKLGTTLVGRGTSCDIQLTDTAASRQHLEIVWDGKQGLVRDLGSTNGSKINGQRFREAQLQPDLIIYIGATPLRFTFVPASAATAPQPNSWEVA